MIRFVVRGKYINPGGDCEGDIKTFDVDLPELERYLSESGSYGSREVIGAEVIPISTKEI